MIKGKISDNGLPIIKMKIIDNRAEIDIDGVLDTGFDGCLWSADNNSSLIRA